MAIKFFVGPVSKNVVDAVIDFYNETKQPIGFIPSRRQIDYNGGYVNNWNTISFTEYVETNAPGIVIQRDHGGPEQGSAPDNGYRSLYTDAKYLRIIHIDPWK